MTAATRHGNRAIKGPAVIISPAAAAEVVAVEVEVAEVEVVEVEVAAANNFVTLKCPIKIYILVVELL